MDAKDEAGRICTFDYNNGFVAKILPYLQWQFSNSAATVIQSSKVRPPSIKSAVCYIATFLYVTDLE